MKLRIYSQTITLEDLHRDGKVYRDIKARSDSHTAVFGLDGVGIVNITNTSQVLEDPDEYTPIIVVGQVVDTGALIALPLPDDTQIYIIIVESTPPMQYSHAHKTSSLN